MLVYLALYIEQAVLKALNKTQHSISVELSFKTCSRNGGFAVLNAALAINISVTNHVETYVNIDIYLVTPTCRIRY